MKLEIIIDHLKESDLPSIKLLLLELTEAVTEAEGFDVEKSIDNCRMLMKNPAHQMLIARDKTGVILGFVNFTTRRTILHPELSGLIDELVVSKTSRGSGVGKKLILAAINRCREIGCCEVEVSTEKSNLEARKFYKACGFGEDAVLLEINLDK